MPSSSPPGGEPLKLSWVDALFARFAAIWPRAWAEQYGGMDRVMLRSEWAQALAGFSGVEIKAGIGHCRNSLAWPASIAEFRAACRPAKALSPEALFHHAAEQWRRRQDGADAWDSPVTYWAAVHLGGDLVRLPYRELRGRWEAALEQARTDVASGRLPAGIPAAPRPVVALAAPPDEPQPERVATEVARLRSASRGAGNRSDAAIAAGHWTPEHEEHYLADARRLGIQVADVFTGEPSLPRPVRRVVATVDQRCAAGGCQQLGSLSRSTGGSGTWYCARHFREAA